MSGACPQFGAHKLVHSWKTVSSSLSYLLAHWFYFLLQDKGISYTHITVVKCFVSSFECVCLISDQYLWSQHSAFPIISYCFILCREHPIFSSTLSISATFSSQSSQCGIIDSNSYRIQHIALEKFSKLFFIPFENAASLFYKITP